MSAVLRDIHATPDDPRSWTGLPEPVRQSWARSLDQNVDPRAVESRYDLTVEQINERRAKHPLLEAKPIVNSLLVEPAQQSGLVVALTDADGTILWLEGDRATLRRAEKAMFVEGSNWSEAAMGTSAPGMALATGQAAQVSRGEHYVEAVRGFSCTAVPMTDPYTGDIIGALDITGGPEAVATHAQALLTAVAAAARTAASFGPAHSTQKHNPVRLKFLGSGAAELITRHGRRVTLSGRHAEILLLIAYRGREDPGGGYSAHELATLLWGDAGSLVSLRAEMTRLRKALAGTGLDVASRPYRLTGPVQCDALELLDALDACDRQRALTLGAKPLLPSSEVATVRELETASRRILREMVLSDGSPEELMSYLRSPLGTNDRWAHEVALRQLPAQSPERARVVVALENWVE